jgi:hypothetical protein
VSTFFSFFGLAGGEPPLEGLAGGEPPLEAAGGSS